MRDTVTFKGCENRIGLLLSFRFTDSLVKIPAVGSFFRADRFFRETAHQPPASHEPHREFTSAHRKGFANDPYTSLHLQYISHVQVQTLCDQSPLGLQISSWCSRGSQETWRSNLSLIVQQYLSFQFQFLKGQVYLPTKNQWILTYIILGFYMQIFRSLTFCLIELSILAFCLLWSETDTRSCTAFHISECYFSICCLHFVLEFVCSFNYFAIRAL